MHVGSLPWYTLSGPSIDQSGPLLHRSLVVSWIKDIPLEGKLAGLSFPAQCTQMASGSKVLISVVQF